MTICVLLLSLLAAPPQTPRDVAVADRGTAVVSGRVTDRETGLPLPGMTVTLRRMDGPGVQPGRVAKTVDDGRYRFTEVAAGSYVLGADPGDNRATHVAQQYGVATPFDPLFGAVQPAKPFDVRSGEIRENLDIAMWRALAIAGTVVNEAGEPLANVPVQARAVLRGRALSGGRARTTDDRGAFRIFGLAPGRYRVCTQSVGHLMEASADSERLIATCYPSATREENVGVVALSGGDVTDVQIRVRQARTVKLTGTVVDATGTPAARATVNVESRERLDRFSGNVTAQDGRFSVEGLIPGEYRLLAYGAVPDESSPPGQFALATLKVDADTDGVVLMMTRTAHVEGHLVFEDGPVPRLSDLVRVRAVFAPGGISPHPALIRENLTFEVRGLFGPHLLEVTNLPPDWTLKAVRYDGADITDVPTAFTSSTDPRAVQIVLTDRGPAVSGRVVDSKGQPFAGARIFIFPADPQRRGRPGDATQSGDDGSFSLARQRAGDYLVAAVPEDDVRFDERPDFDLLAKVAERVTLYEGEQRSLTLRLASLPEARR